MMTDSLVAAFEDLERQVAARERAAHFAAIKIACDHPDRQTLWRLDGGAVQEFCVRCGSSFLVTDTTGVATFQRRNIEGNSGDAA